MCCKGFDARGQISCWGSRIVIVGGHVIINSGVAHINLSSHVLLRLFGIVYYRSYVKQQKRFWRRKMNYKSGSNRTEPMCSPTAPK